MICNCENHRKPDLHYTLAQAGWYALSAILILSMTACQISLPFQQAFGCPKIPIGVVIAAETVVGAQEQAEGYDQAVREVNKAGGVKNCPITVVYNRSEGAQTNLEAVQTAMLDLSNKEGVVAILGATSNGASKRVAALSGYINTPIIITTDTADDVFNSRNQWLFRLSLANSAYAEAAFSMAIDNLDTPPGVAIFYEHNEYGESAAVSSGTVAINLNLTISSYTGYNPGSDNYLEVLEKLKSDVGSSTNNILYIISSNSSQALAIVARVKEMKLPFTYIIGNGSGFSSRDFLYDANGAPNPDLDKVIVTLPWTMDLAWKGIPELNTTLLAQRKTDKPNLPPYPMVSRTAQAYVGLNLVVEVLKTLSETNLKDWALVMAKPTTFAATFRPLIAENLRNLKGSDHTGIMGPIEFDANGELKTKPLLAQFIEGQLVTIYPKGELDTYRNFHVPVRADQ